VAKGSGKAAIAGRKDEESAYTALRSADDLLVVAAGGPAGGFGRHDLHARRAGSGARARTSARDALGSRGVTRALHSFRLPPWRMLPRDRGPRRSNR
jgi:hypothetical protein